MVRPPIEPAWKEQSNSIQVSSSRPASTSDSILAGRLRRKVAQPRREPLPTAKSLSSSYPYYLGEFARVGGRPARARWGLVPHALDGERPTFPARWHSAGPRLSPLPC